MKLPSALDVGLVMVVLIGLQTFFANVPESQGWWAPAIAAALLAATKVLEVWLVTPKPATVSQVVPADDEPVEEDSPASKLGLAPAGAAVDVAAQKLADERARAILAVGEDLISTWRMESGIQIVEVRVPADAGWLRRWLND